MMNDSLMRPPKHVKLINKINFDRFLPVYNYKLDVDLTYVLSRDKSHACLIINHADGWKRNKPASTISNTI